MSGCLIQHVRRFRIPALLCSLAVLVCELISHPYAAMGICDDGPYIVMTRTLATTGHLIYNGWATPILGWQLFLGAALIKLFGFSFTTVRMSTLLVAMALAFVLQRTLVRAGISERNATIGTLALVLSPLYLMLCYAFVRVVLRAEWPAGFTTLAALILLSISINAMLLGIIGEYLGRMYRQVRETPVSIIESSIDNAPDDVRR